VPTVINMARRLGIRSSLPDSLSLALGACEVTPMEVAAVYNTIAARGLFSRPHLVRTSRFSTFSRVLLFFPRSVYFQLQPRLWAVV
jgi:membrane peptidoglycan carboxypeptidase